MKNGITLALLYIGNCLNKYSTSISSYLQKVVSKSVYPDSGIRNFCINPKIIMSIFFLKKKEACSMSIFALVLFSYANIKGIYPRLKDILNWGLCNQNFTVRTRIHIFSKNRETSKA